MTGCSSSQPTVSRSGGASDGQGSRGSYVVELEPLPAGAPRFPSDRILGLLVPAIGLIYLAIGAVVFQVRSDRREAWALLLFCCSTAALLFLSSSVDPFNWNLTYYLLRDW